MGRRAGRRRLTRREKIEAGGRRSEVGSQKSEVGGQKSDSGEQDAEKIKIKSISPETRIMMALIRNRYGIKLNETII